jgi:quercetin dioxygenase-like cupin family protein
VTKRLRWTLNEMARGARARDQPKGSRTVRIGPLVEAQEPAHGRGARVTLEPTARTAWHTHPLGLTLIVSTGVGRVQPWAGPVEEIRPGDVVWFPPGEKHWHDAASTTDDAYRYSGGGDGKVVDWIERIIDKQYRAYELLRETTASPLCANNGHQVSHQVRINMRDLRRKRRTPIEPFCASALARSPF